MTAHNIAASVRQKLLNRAKQLGEDFQLLLTRFANERLLYRLSQSPFRDQFVLRLRYARASVTGGSESACWASWRWYGRRVGVPRALGLESVRHRWSKQTPSRSSRVSERARVRATGKATHNSPTRTSTSSAMIVSSPDCVSSSTIGRYVESLESGSRNTRECCHVPDFSTAFSLW